MDKSFWQHIMENEYAVPTGYSVATLTAELLSYLGLDDTELREEAAYKILSEWIDQHENYSHAERWEMATQMLHNLTISLGEQEQETIFLRSFSVLILTEIVYHDLTHPTLTETEVQHILEQVLAYFAAERDLRGYIPEKGWAHAIAHAGDCFMVLAQHRFVSAADLWRIMETIAEKITTPVAHAYLYDEGDRLVRPVMSVLQRDLLPLPLLATWLEHLTHPKGRTAWSVSFASGKMDLITHSSAETCARHNTKSFLYSLYFQLRSPGFANMTHMKHRPARADELIALVEDALSQIRTWC